MPRPPCATSVASRQRGTQLRWIIAVATALCIAGSAVVGVGASPPLQSVLTIDQVVVAPDTVRDGKPFTVTARVTNRGQEALADLRWYPSVAVGPGEQRDRPQMEVLERSPQQLTLGPGQSAQISLAFRATSPGERIYGIAVGGPAVGMGAVIAADPHPRTTLANSAGYVARSWLLRVVPGGLLLGIFGVFLWRSARARQSLRSQIAFPPTPADALTFGGAALALFVALDLPQIVTWLGAMGWLPGSDSAWFAYVFIPARWLIPIAVAVILAKGKTSLLYTTMLFLAAYAFANRDLVGKVPASTLLRLLLPSILLGVFCGVLRSILRERRHYGLATALSLASLFCYLGLAWPYLKLYVALLQTQTG